MRRTDFSEQQVSVNLPTKDDKQVIVSKSPIEIRNDKQIVAPVDPPKNPIEPQSATTIEPQFIKLNKDIEVNIEKRNQE